MIAQLVPSVQQLLRDCVYSKLGGLFKRILSPTTTIVIEGNPAKPVTMELNHTLSLMLPTPDGNKSAGEIATIVDSIMNSVVNDQGQHVNGQGADQGAITTESAHPCPDPVHLGMEALASVSEMKGVVLGNIAARTGAMASQRQTSVRASAPNSYQFLFSLPDSDFAKLVHLYGLPEVTELIDLFFVALEQAIVAGLQRSYRQHVHIPWIIVLQPNDAPDDRTQKTLNKYHNYQQARDEQEGANNVPNNGE